MYKLSTTKESKQGRGCLVLFALFWTGFSLVWTYMAWRGGGAMALFGIPFILIGVAMLAGAFWRSIAGLKIAPPVISVSNPQPVLGEKLRMEWELRFRVPAVLQEGKVELVFRESASYTQGTDRRTDTHEQIVDFIELPIGEMTTGKSTQGYADTTIPVSGMHSFQASNNRLDWLLRLRLHVQDWPDIIDEFALDVQPRKVW